MRINEKEQIVGDYKDDTTEFFFECDLCNKENVYFYWGCRGSIHLGFKYKVEIAKYPDYCLCSECNGETSIKGLILKDSFSERKIDF